MFGSRGSELSTITTIDDTVALNTITLESVLPVFIFASPQRESASKETDGALLSILSFPGFAIESEELYQQTKNKVVRLTKSPGDCGS